MSQNLPPILFLSADEIRRTNITIKEVIEVVEAVLFQHGTGAVEMAPRTGIYPRVESFTQALLAHVPALDAAGAKIVSVFPGNQVAGLPVTTALLLLTAPTTGVPLAFMDATLITAMRTGAVTAIAAKFLARQGSREVAIIGAGVQGRSSLSALATVLPELATVRVYDRRPEAAAGFVDEFERETSIHFQAVNSAQEAVEAADVIVTATAVFKERTPLVRRAWIRPGALIAPLEVDRALEAALVYEPDLLVVDDTDQTLEFQKMGCFEDGVPSIHAELGEIVARKSIGRTDDRQIIVAMNVGLPIEDIAVAHHVYKGAAERQLGQHIRYS